MNYRRSLEQKAKINSPRVITSPGAQVSPSVAHSVVKRIRAESKTSKESTLSTYSGVMMKAASSLSLVGDNEASLPDLSPQSGSIPNGPKRCRTQRLASDDDGFEIIEDPNDHPTLTAAQKKAAVKSLYFK